MVRSTGNLSSICYVWGILGPHWTKIVIFTDSQSQKTDMQVLHLILHISYYKGHCELSRNNTAI